MKEAQDILDYFDILNKRDCLGAAYLFIGKDMDLFNNILKVISCQEEQFFCSTCWDCKMLDSEKHPDLFVIEPQGLTTRIDQIREAMRFLSLKSFQLKKKIVVLKDGNSLSPAAANAFLKTLEEPPKNSLIAICVSKLEGILPTIVSRCRKIFLPSKTHKLIELDKRSVFKFLDGEKLAFKDRAKFLSFLWTLVVFLHKELISRNVDIEKSLFIGTKYQRLIEAYDQDQIHGILEDVLKIYGAYNSVNINLALNLIRMKLN